MDTEERPGEPAGPGGTIRTAQALTRLVLLAAAALAPLLVARQGRDLKMHLAVLAALAALPALPFFIRNFRPVWPFILWLGWLGALGGLAPYATSLAEAGRQSSFLLLLPLGASAFRKGEIGHLTRLWLVTFAFVAAYTVMQKAGLDPVTEFRNWHSTARPFSTFGNPDFLGAHCAFLLPLFLGAALRSSARRSRIGWGITTAADAAILLLTFSRGAWLGACAGAATWALLSFPSSVIRRRLPVFAALLGAAAIGLWAADLIPWQHLLRRTDRVMLWQGTLEMVRVRPVLGWGPGCFPPEYPRFAPPAFAERMRADNTFAEHPHSEYLHVAVECGLIGLGLFIWLLAAIFRQGLSAAYRGDSLAPSALGALAAIAVHILVDRNFRLASTAVPFWLLAGALFAGDTPRTVAGETGAARMRVAAAIALVLACAGLSALSLRPLAASYRVAAERDFLEGRPEMPAAELERQRTARANDPVFFVRLGNAYAQEKDFPRAAIAFAEALRLDPRDVAAANNLGNSMFMMSRFDDAIAAYHRALAIKPDHHDARFNMAFAYFHKRDIKRALEECDILLKMDPGNPKALQLRGQLAP